MNVIQQLWNELLRVWGGMGRRQRLLASILGVGSLLMLGLFAVWASRPDYTTAYTSLAEEDAAAIVDVLQKMEVPYQLTGNGTTIRVPSREVYRVRLEVARQGLPRGGTVGFELFDRGGLGNLGMTEFTQRINYQRALGGELSRTISALDGVEQARVHLMIPEKTLFTQNQSKPTASVMLVLRPGRSLSEDQIWGIGNVVAGSVEGLEAENVTIVDVHGRVLAEGAGSQATNRPNLRFSMAQLSAERDVERDLEERLQQMLDTALGPNKAVVSVSAELDWVQVETTSERFEPETESQAGVVRSLRQTVESSGGITVTGGVPGVDANVVPIYQPVLTGTQGADVVRHDSIINFEVSKSVTHTVNAPGNIKRLSVAVLLDSNDTNLVAQKPAIEQMVQAAIGYNGARGDTVAVDLLPFDDSLAEEAKAMEEAARRAWYMQLARLGAAVLSVLVLFFFARRAFCRLEEQVLVDLGPAPVPQFESPATGTLIDIMNTENMEEIDGASGAAELIKHLRSGDTGIPFSFMRGTEPAQLVKFLEDEHPQTIALILSYLTPEHAAQILSELGAELQRDVAERIVLMEQAAPEVVSEVERGLADKLSPMLTRTTYEAARGIDSLVAIMKLVNRSTEKTILEHLSETNSHLADEIRAKMFVFEDLVVLDDRSVQIVLREIDRKDLALALRGAPPKIHDLIMRNLSTRARQMLEEEIEAMGPQRLSAVEQAQQRIVDVVRRMEESEEILVGRGGAAGIVV